MAFNNPKIKSVLTVGFLFVLLLSACEKKDLTKEELLAQGVKFFENKHYEQAIQSYKKALEIDKKNAPGFNLLGMAYRFRFNETGDQKFKNLEIQAFKQALEIYPDFIAAIKNLAVSYYYMGQKKESVPLLKKALELNPYDREKEMMEKWIKEGEGQGSD